MAGWGKASQERDRGGPRQQPRSPAPGRLLSLSPLPTLISRWSPHISESASFSDRRGGCPGSLAEGAGLPDLHSPRGGAERTPISPEWTVHGPPSCFPPATLPIPARMSLRNANQVLPIPPENLPGASHGTEHKRHALPELQDPPGFTPCPADFSPWLLLQQGCPQTWAPWLLPQGLCTCRSHCSPRHLHRACAFLSLGSRFPRHLLGEAWLPHLHRCLS